MPKPSIPCDVASSAMREPRRRRASIRAGRALAVVVAGLVLAASACSSDPGVAIDPAQALETSVRDLVRARSLADLDEGRSQSPVDQFVSSRCVDAEAVLDPVFAFSSVRSYGATIDGDTAAVSYDVAALPGVNADGTPDTGIVAPGPPIEVRDERWSRSSGAWRWDDC